MENSLNDTVWTNMLLTFVATVLCFLVLTLHNVVTWMRTIPKGLRVVIFLCLVISGSSSAHAYQNLQRPTALNSIVFEWWYGYSILLSVIFIVSSILLYERNHPHVRESGD